MITSKRYLIIALLIPIFVLAALSASKKLVLLSGTEVVLPISGYDPLDLLSGHYLVYRVDYEVNNLCQGEEETKAGFVCLSAKSFSIERPQGCSTFIRGICKYGRFEAGVEKYFIPEGKAQALEEKVRTKAASIVLSVMSDGQAQVKDLLIDGKPWKDE